jgi:hypothetical protein
LRDLLIVCHRGSTNYIPTNSVQVFSPLSLPAFKTGTFLFYSVIVYSVRCFHSKLNY